MEIFQNTQRPLIDSSKFYHILCGHVDTTQSTASQIE